MPNSRVSGGIGRRMVIKVINYDDEARGNTHILKLWARLIAARWPQVTTISHTAESPRRLIVQVAPTHKEDYDIGEIITRTVEIHTESFENYGRFLRRHRISVMHYEREIARVYGDSCIFRTSADLFFHGFRNSDPPETATEILNPFFFWTGKLKRYLNELVFENADEPRKPRYLVPPARRKIGPKGEEVIEYSKVYDGWRIGTWRQVSTADIERRTNPPVDRKKLIRGPDGSGREFYTTVGMLLPWRDVRDCMTLEPFAPTLFNFRAGLDY